MTPAVTVVVALDTVESGAALLAALEAQTIADQLEVVVVGPLGPAPSLPSRHLLVRHVEHPIPSLAGARAAGILAARAPVVFIAENHALPRPDCLELLVAAVAGGADAAMPRFANANPARARSWASLFTTYARFTHTAPGAVPAVSLHNAVFTAARLQHLAATDPNLLIYGVGISAALTSDGASMRYVPAAVVDHLNITTLRGLVSDRLLGPWLWAGLRCGRWGPARRSLYVLGGGFTLFPFLIRLFRSPGWREHRGRLPRGTVLALLLYAPLQALGESLGYLLGPRLPMDRHVPLELHRERYC